MAVMPQCKKLKDNGKTMSLSYLNGCRLSVQETVLQRTKTKKNVDTLAKAGACEVPEPLASLTFLEILNTSIRPL
ncbi:hypothetical protein TNCV_3826921 [Trichonephila clavipes]|nr:hypothetical protein TNCV_3826921 [Trichonephila clavipes]